MSAPASEQDDEGPTRAASGRVDRGRARLARRFHPGGTLMIQRPPRADRLD